MKIFQSIRQWIALPLLLISVCYMPLGFGKAAHGLYKINYVENEPGISASAIKLYSSLNLNSMGLSENAFAYAMQGLEKLKASGKILNSTIISVIDFTKSSAEKRLFVIDLENEIVLFNTYVAHGQNSGVAYAKKFSNIPSSLQSSLGFYQTSGTYIGKHGYSMQLIGLEKGINDLADERAIVFHGAAYVSEALAKSQGYIGRSWGCPAVSEKLSKPIIDKIKNGSCLFIYANDRSYLSHSNIING